MITGTTPTLELICDMSLDDLDEFSIMIAARARHTASRMIVAETLTLTNTSACVEYEGNRALIWLTGEDLEQLISVDPLADYVMLYIQLRGRAGLQQIASREFARRLSRTGLGEERNDRIVQMAVRETGGVIRQHGTLFGRDSPDAHPMSAISGLNAALEAMAQSGGGGSGGGDKTYHHTQYRASTSWVIEHNLGKMPAIEVIDSGGNTIIGDVAYTDTNHLTLTFSHAFAGDAYLN